MCKSVESQLHRFTRQIIKVIIYFYKKSHAHLYAWLLDSNMLSDGRERHFIP